MSLRIRRGTDAQRQAQTFDQGEIVYTTDTKKIFVGDGITTGGVNALATSAGVGLTFNSTTQSIDFDAGNLGLTTDDVQETVSPNNLWFTTQRAQDAAASLFTSVGSPTSSGTITGTITPATVTVSVAPSNMAQGERFVVSGTGGNGLSAGTYYVVSVIGTAIVLANSLANAMDNTPISSLTTGSVTGTTYQAGGTDAGITFIYDPINHVMNVTSTGTGLTAISQDTSPALGGNLSLSSHNISGSGSINITGLITGTSTNSATNIFNAVGTANGADTSATLSLSSSRSGTTALTTGDSVGVIYAEGYNGTAYKKSMILSSALTGTVQGNGSFNADTTMYVLNADNSYRTFTFHSTGAFLTLSVGFTPLTTAEIGSVTPDTGAVVYNSDTSLLQVYTGSAYHSIPNVVTAPVSASSAGKPGQVAYDSTYFYVCIATNTWKRASLGSW